MRNIIELVDEFIEGFFDGSIVSVRHDQKTADWIRENVKQESQEVLDKEMSRLIDILIPQYREVSGEKKQEFADAIHGSVIHLRANAYLRNNPDTLKETTYWKNRCLTVELQNKELTETVMALKAGKSGIS